MENWRTREVELNQRHEELLLRREALLHGTETYYDNQDKRSASFIADYAKAKERNMQLLKDLYKCKQDIHNDMQDPGTPKFNSLRTNYWTMVRNVFPVWYEDLQEYEHRHTGKTPRSQIHEPPRPLLTPGSRTPGSTREMSTDTLESIPHLNLDSTQGDDASAHTPHPPTLAPPHTTGLSSPSPRAGNSPSPRPGSAASGDRKTPKRVSYPGEEQMEMTVVYDADDAPSSSRRKEKGKGKEKKTKDKKNKAKKSNK